LLFEYLASTLGLNQWGLCDALFSNYFENDLFVGSKRITINIVGLRYLLHRLRNIPCGSKMQNTQHFGIAICSCHSWAHCKSIYCQFCNRYIKLQVIKQRQRCW